MIKGLLLIFVTLFNLNLGAQLPQLDSLCNSYFEKGLFEGTVLIADDTGIVYQNSFGYANHDHSIPNTLNTVFSIGSISKPFTAMLVLQLIEKGRLQLNTSISKYLPEYRKDIGDKVTIQHLLTHTHGIPGYTGLPNVWEDSMQLTYTSSYILRNFASRNLEAEPGTKYKYGSTGYFILAQIIERIMGKPLADVLKENIFVPLKMFHSGINDNRIPIRNKTSGYYRLGKQYISEPYIYNLNTIGGSGIHSTANDLYFFDRALYTNQLLSKETMQLYTSLHQKVEPNYAYGFGWEFTRLALEKNDTIETMEHSGAIRGFRSLLIRVPAEKKCVIILSNAASQSGYDLFENIMRVFRGKEWNQPKKLLADTLFSFMQSTSVEKAIELYKTLKATDSTQYDYSSYSLELLGERLLMLRMYPEAAGIFQLAVNEFPKYTYGYLFLGRAYEKLGKKENAIKSYMKAVAQDKNSRPGVDAAFQLKYLKGIK